MYRKQEFLLKSSLYQKIGTYAITVSTYGYLLYFISSYNIQDMHRKQEIFFLNRHTNKKIIKTSAFNILMFIKFFHIILKKWRINPC